MFKEKNISNSPGKPKHEALKNVIAQQNLMYQRQGKGANKNNIGTREKNVLDFKKQI